MSSTKFKNFCNLNRLSGMNEDPLFCGKCKNWLTNQIFLHSKGQYFCHSCIPNNSGQRIVALENVFKNLLYPCLHKVCDFVTNGEQIQAHMKNCKHAPSNNCYLCDYQNMDVNTYRNHLKSQHADALINIDVPVVTFSLKQLDKNDKIIAVLKQHIFLVYIKYIDFQLMVNIARLGNEDGTDLSDTFNVYLRCNNSKQKITKGMVAASNISEVTGTTDINIDVINATHIEIYLCNYNKVTRVGECPICEHYLGIKVYQCANGHNVCNDCGKKITACAICRSNSIYLVNCQFLFPNAFVACPNAENGCLYIDVKAEMECHVNSCSYSDRQCFICDENVWKNDINSHMIIKHTDRVFRNNHTLSVRLLDAIRLNTLYIIYNARVFAIDLKIIGFTTIKKIGFSCRLVGNEDIGESENYKFEILILDKGVEGKIVNSLENNCQITNDKSFVLYLYFDSWKKYMSDDNMAFFRCLITSKVNKQTRLNY